MSYGYCAISAICVISGTSGRNTYRAGSRRVANPNQIYGPLDNEVLTSVVFRPQFIIDNATDNTNRDKVFYCN